MTTCDYHDLPAVCDTCGYEESSYEINHGLFTHEFIPVHVMPDPEGWESPVIVPCGLA